MGQIDYLSAIVARKRLEVQRRRRFARAYAQWAECAAPPVAEPERMLFRGTGDIRVIAEIKGRSPSAGEIRARVPGERVRIARGYVRAGAAAVSVLCDGPGFGGSVLDLRRAARAIDAPLLFKEFVVDELQLDCARAAGASFALLLAAVLDDGELERLCRGCHARGLQPVVEVADARELARGLALPVRILGINARDLRSFRVDRSRALRLADAVPADRVAVFMSGVRTRADLDGVRNSRADAALVGEGLMRAGDPGEMLREWLAGA